LLVSHLVEDDASRFHRASIRVHEEVRRVKDFILLLESEKPDDDDCGGITKPFERLVAAELIAESPGYRDIELQLKFATTKDDLLTFSTKVIRLTPESFEDLRGILGRVVTGWCGQLPLDSKLCPHHHHLS
jgi:hypothetical protein